MEVYPEARKQPWEVDASKLSALADIGIDEDTYRAIVHDLFETDKPASIREIIRRYHVHGRIVRQIILAYRQDQEAASDAHDARMVAKYEAVEDQLLAALTKDKLAKAGARDISIALGIVRDKLAIVRGKRSSDGGIRAKVAWRTPDGHEMGLEIG